jgi:NAD(P)-dependent dehydrogenase (short-subunit alcohol dehydrogenase family)
METGRSVGSDRVALVTGGAGGIGRAIAETLADRGYAVIATGLTAAEVAAAPTRESISFVRLDVTDANAVNQLVAGCSRLDALINAAGAIQRGGLEFTIQGFRQTIEVNLIGTMSLCLAARAKLAASHGAIVNLASMLSFFGSPYAPGYAASKGGVAQLTKSLASAWAAEGIRVNALAPGWIATALTQPLQDDPERSAGILARTPMGRWGAPADVAGVVAFLLSDEARFMTGAIVPVDGGYLSV